MNTAHRRPRNARYSWEGCEGTTEELASKLGITRHAMQTKIIRYNLQPIAKQAVSEPLVPDLTTTRHQVDPRTLYSVMDKDGHIFAGTRQSLAEQMHLSPQGVSMRINGHGKVLSNPDGTPRLMGVKYNPEPSIIYESRPRIPHYTAPYTLDFLKANTLFYREAALMNRDPSIESETNADFEARTERNIERIKAMSNKEAAEELRGWMKNEVSLRESGKRQATYMTTNPRGLDLTNLTPQPTTPRHVLYETWSYKPDITEPISLALAKVYSAWFTKEALMHNHHYPNPATLKTKEDYLREESNEEFKARCRRNAERLDKIEDAEVRKLVEQWIVNEIEARSEVMSVKQPEESING